jgi:type I restriction enzyme R subunit
MALTVTEVEELRRYPPDLQDSAVQTVLQQAEALSSGWTVSRGGIV